MTGSWVAPKRYGRQLALDFPLSELQAHVADAVEHTAGHAKHSARSAIFHLGRAWQIRSLDPEMAAFRAITAEEEAATAIFRSVKRHSYSGAKNLNPYDHVHKNAVSVFVAVLGRALADAGLLDVMQPTLSFDPTDSSVPPILKLKVPIVVDGKETWVAPEPPLGFRILVNGKEHDFKDEFAKVEAELSANTLRKHLEAKAGKRNELLYSTKNGVPIVDPSNMAEVVRDHYGADVFRLLMLYLLIDGYEAGQVFVEQGLRAFLSIVAKATIHS